MLIKILTPQEIFNKVVIGLRKQGCRSTCNGDRFECAYRGDNGAKCPTGMLILDEFYTPDLEDRISSHELVMDVLEKSGINRLHGPLVDILQTIHDCCGVDEWEEEWAVLANLYGLSVPPKE